MSGWFARSRVTRPGAYRLGRILRSAEAAHDDAALQRVAERLDAGCASGSSGLLVDDGDGTAYARLAADPGRVGLESLLAEIAKLEQLRALALPSDLVRGLHPDQAKRFRRRAAVESAWELRRHPERIRLPLLAFWCAPREAEVVDGLVELLIQVTHRITVKAERRVVEELVEEAREVRGKTGILFRVVEAASGSPEGIVREVIFPAIGEQTFDALVREARALGTPQSRRVHTAVRASYGSYYRRMMPKLLAALDFRSNNGTHRPLLDALDAIRRAEGEGRQFFKADEVTIEGVIRPKWRDIVLEDAPGGGQRVNRINYEICVLQTLRERLRCKEVWVVGAGRFRNPDADLPADFAERRAACYERLGLPTEARAFTDALRAEMAEALQQLNRGMPRNPGVRLDPRRRHPIMVSPLEPQPEPSGLGALKTELGPALVDDRAAGRVQGGGPSDRLHRGVRDGGIPGGDRPRRGTSPAAAVPVWAWHQCRAEAPRCRAAWLQLQGTAAHLAPLHRRRVVARRDKAGGQCHPGRARPRIWGDGTTACASDSKHFGAFDQNLMTEWHVRYGGRGVMIYWHVERVGVHPFPAAALLLIGGRRHDRGRAAPRHRDGGRAPVRGQPRPERGGVRLLPDARLPVAATAQGDLGAAALSAAGRDRLALPGFVHGSHIRPVPRLRSTSSRISISRTATSLACPASLKTRSGFASVSTGRRRTDWRGQQVSRGVNWGPRRCG